MVASAENPGKRGPAKVVGRYALYGEIAAGGMATVHIGRLLGPVGFARTVAIKRLHAQFAKDPEFVSMFLDEARLAARVQHPNVAATIDVVATDGELFLIMDYVRGESLSRLVRATVKQDEWIPPRVVSSIMCGFLHGLHAAHEAKNERGEPLGLIHRDVSPQNVLVGSDGVARVLDFGVAKAAGRIQVTREGQVKGKLAYMPPEQLSGAPLLTRAVDVYASAVVLWEALTGERLFKGESEGETLHKILRGTVEPPSARVQGLDPRYDAVCLKALARDPAQRYATAREMALALERCEGIASPTDVGEWVERIAGQALLDREERIAEIESDSAGLAAPQSARHVPAAPPSDSSVSRAPHPAGFVPPKKIESTLVGVGPMSGSQIATATEVGGPVSSNRSGPPTGQHRKRSASLSDSDVAAKHASGTSGLSRLMTLPLDKRLPYIIIGGASLVLAFVIIAGIVLIHGARGATADPAASASASASPSASSASAAASAAGAAADSAEAPVGAQNPTPQIEGSAKPQDTVGSSAPATPSATQTAQTQTPPPPPRPVQAWVRPAATAAPKKPTNCDPPFTIDAKGHKHYKVECN